ncbi:hypothetical protein [Nocardioides sp. W7]|uniref:hypothetical protein n=1 Tax=Nocardioides sp. W7 TaxID=2931390 RepID=UPI001FD10C6B|nr:hypothetical protein [Nocardioides sp. W7]
MSSPTRPPQATFAAGLAIGGSVLLVLFAFETVSGLRSLETRQAVEEFVARPPGEGMGLDVEQVLGIMRGLAMVAAASAAAIAVLGVYALQRSRPARLALTVLAPLLAVSGLVLGGMLSSAVAVAIVMLWLQPSRDWFNGVAPRPAPERRPERTPDPEPPTPWQQPPPPASVPSTSEPRPYAGFGNAPQPHQAPLAPGAPAPYQPHGAARPGAPGPRPPAVLWACVLTWVLTTLIAGGMLLTAVVVGLSPELVLDEVRRREPTMADDITEDMLVGTAIAMAAIVVLWCVAAAVLAWFAFRRAQWAQVSLLVSAGAAAACCLLGAGVGTFPLLVPLAACAVTFSLLLRPEVRAWYAARGTI